MEILFLDEQHEERFSTLIIEADTSVADMERNALFYLISGNQELYAHRYDIYDFQRNMLKDRKLINKISSSGRQLIKLGIHLYNTCAQKNINVCDLFSILDEQNQQLALNTICLRFKIQQMIF